MPRCRGYASDAAEGGRVPGVRRQLRWAVKAAAGGVSLPRMQRWMQEVVVHPGEIAEAVASPSARKALGRAAIEDVILPSRTLGPADRVGIYQGMYLMRMEEALESDYSALKHLLGGRAFSALVRDYVAAHPSVTYTLNRLGDHFPDFVATWPGVAAARPPRISSSAGSASGPPAACSSPSACADRAPALPAVLVPFPRACSSDG